MRAEADAANCPDGQFRLGPQRRYSVSIARQSANYLSHAGASSKQRHSTVASRRRETCPGTDSTEWSQGVLETFQLVVLESLIACDKCCSMRTNRSFSETLSPSSSSWPVLPSPPARVSLSPWCGGHSAVMAPAGQVRREPRAPGAGHAGDCEALATGLEDSLLTGASRASGCI